MELFAGGGGVAEGGGGDAVDECVAGGGDGAVCEGGGTVVDSGIDVVGEAAAVEELPCSVLGVGLGSGAGIVEATKSFRFVKSVLPLVWWLSWWGFRPGHY